MANQYVCTVCGYNMVGYHPDRCPFCGAPQERFITAEECSARFTVMSTRVNDYVTRLNSVPALGFEHAAYRIKTTDGEIWVDCPSCYDRRLEAVKYITFTHHHFLGASNRYREHFGAQVRIHQDDSSHRICKGFTFDRTFDKDAVEDGVESYHVDGHTPGFTFYVFKETLFICDYVFYNLGSMRFNPFGPAAATRDGGKRINEIIGSRKIEDVCGVHYVAKYKDWKPLFDKLLAT
ncbi:MAG: MBL fold metallo-hydrolase [Chloroflexi bacterium]|nr:MBL fold metallo-hydrolase [Chloroflexota bacterium]